jgi:hypothetical protein
MKQEERYIQVTNISWMGRIMNWEEQHISILCSHIYIYSNEVVHKDISSDPGFGINRYFANILVF